MATDRVVVDGPTAMHMWARYLYLVSYQLKKKSMKLGGEHIKGYG